MGAFPYWNWGEGIRRALVRLPFTFQVNLKSLLGPLPPPSNPGSNGWPSRVKPYYLPNIPGFFLKRGIFLGGIKKGD